MYDAWLTIDRGRTGGDEQLVWEGNRALLRYEQEVTLQEGIYDHNRHEFSRLSGRIVGWFTPLASPIPGDDTTFQSYGGGDVGDFDDRWAWIDGSMLPAWRELEPDLQDKLWEFTQ